MTQVKLELADFVFETLIEETADTMEQLQTNRNNE